MAENADSRTPLLKQASSQQHSVQQKVGHLLGDWWLWEILGAALSLLAILAIAVIFVTYDSSSLPDWPFVFTVRQYFLRSSLFQSC